MGKHYISYNSKNITMEVDLQSYTVKLSTTYLTSSMDKIDLSNLILLSIIE